MANMERDRAWWTRAWLPGGGTVQQQFVETALSMLPPGFATVLPTTLARLVLTTVRVTPRRKCNPAPLMAKTERGRAWWTRACRRGGATARQRGVETAL